MYISAYHRADPASGCVMPTLSADVARSNPQIRAAYERKMLELVRKMANALDGAGPKSVAWYGWIQEVPVSGNVNVPRPVELRQPLKK